MEQNESDWNEWNMNDGEDVDSVIDSYQKQDDSSLSAVGSKADSVYDGSTLGGEDDYNLALYDGYDSYNESNSSDTETYSENQQSTAPPDIKLQIPEKPTAFRFMNGKEGMATCEKCGTIGVKHAFYSKSKRFCSLSCSRSFATAQREGKPSGKGSNTSIQTKSHHVTKKQASVLKVQSHHRTFPTSISCKPGSEKCFDWGPYLMSSCAEAAPVSSFRHVPMADSWDNITVGMKVEVQNYDTDITNVFWIATVTKIAGYKALMRYEGFGNDSSQDFWLNLCTQDVHPVGWCATIGKPLVPPKSIQNKYPDWKDFLVKRLTGARTLPSNFYNKVLESMQNHKFRRGLHVEVVNKMCVSAMRVASVDEIVGGRLRLQYEDAQMVSPDCAHERRSKLRKDETDEFWCHMKSPLIHHVGWSLQVGHKLHASQEYKHRCLGNITMQKYDPDDATPDIFQKDKEPPSDSKFMPGMKLEAIDPLNLSAMCVATVMKVLKNNYLMIGIDGSMAQNGSDWFCYHATSPCIFPVGFCEVNNLELTPPRGYKCQFRWFDYLKQTKSLAAPVKLFDKEIPKHGFKPGMKLEAVDLMEPRLICVGTIARVVGRLLRVHFDGWEQEYDQWVDCETPDLYPVGWCEIMNYSLEGPRIRESIHVMPTAARKRKGKTQIYKGPRKKRKPKFGGRPPSQNGSAAFHGGSVRPPHVPMSSEAVAAALPPLLDNSNTDSSMEASDLKTASVKSDEVGYDKDDSLASDIPPALSPHTPTPTSEFVPIDIGGIKMEIVTTSNPSPSVVSGMTAINGGLIVAGQAAVSGLLKASSQSADYFIQPAHGNQLQAVVTPSSPLTIPVTSSAHIPRVIHQDGESETLSLTTRQQTIIPEMWTVFDVCQFLRINDCGAHCDSFTKKNIDGRKFMSLTKEQIVNLTGMKVGPSLKIYDLIQQLKQRVVSQGHQLFQGGQS